MYIVRRVIITNSKLLETTATKDNMWRVQTWQLFSSPVLSSTDIFFKILILHLGHWPIDPGYNRTQQRSCEISLGFAGSSLLFTDWC